MKSVVLHAPVATLGAAATSPPTPTTAGEGRVTEVVPADPNGASTILVVGASQCGKSSVINTLLGPPVLAPTGGAAVASVPRPVDRSAARSALTAAAAVNGVTTGRVPSAAVSEPAPAVGAPTTPVVAGQPVTSAFLSFRHGDSPAAFGYVPGHRAPRPLSIDDVRGGDRATAVRGGPGRPPRRVEVLHPAELLRRVNLVDSPGAGGFDQAYTDVVLDALGPDVGLLFVADSATAIQPAELDFLARVEQLGVPTIFVLTKIDAHPEWPAVLSADQNLVHDHAPGLATAAWYAVSTLPDRDVVAPAALEEAALGLAGVGVAALRRALTEPPPREAGRAAVAPALAPARRSAPPVVAATGDLRWMEVLDSEIRSHRAAVAQRLALDLAAIQIRCAQAASGESGGTRLAHAFDRELHALSVRATAAVDAAATAVMRLVFAEILGGEPDAEALARIRRATRRAVASAESGAPEWDRALLVTSTSAIAVTAGRGAVGSLAAVRPAPLDEALLPPIGVGLSAGCYAAWRAGGDRRECQGWLQQAIRVLEGSLDRECGYRFDHLRDALTVVAADTVDHGVLLA